MLQLTAWILLLLHLTCTPLCTEAKSRRPRRDVVINEGPTHHSLLDAGLGYSTISSESLLERGKQYYHDTTTKNFAGNVLGYVTPWNQRGYEVAVKFNTKFTHISPVWYQLKGVEGEIELQGRHEVNQTWMQALRTPAAEGLPVPKLVPRFISELEGEDMVALLTTSASDVARMLRRECEELGFDGVVFEVWMHWVMMNVIRNDDYRAFAVRLLNEIATELHASSPPKELILAVPPAVPARHNMPDLGLDAFKEVLPFVDGFSVMTYDFSTEPGANSPLSWLETNVQQLLRAGQEAGEAGTSAKLLMGTNFYGYKFSLARSGTVVGRDAIVAAEFLELLQKHRPDVGWHEEEQEHFVEVKSGKQRVSVWFPTPFSLQQRLDVLGQQGAGLSIWELGQGLDSFMDVL